MDKALLIFIKNPELGKVKTRLAATVGEQKALEIYHFLLQHTRTVSRAADAHRHLFYSKFIDANDAWAEPHFKKHLQDPASDLGQKMHSAFEYIAQKHYQKALIIGSDCLELSTSIIDSAFHLLNENHAVIGPAKDGGYYSIGFNLKKLTGELPHVLDTVFLHKTWSHSEVFQEARESFELLNLNYGRLPILSDVDVADDIRHLV